MSEKNLTYNEAVERLEAIMSRVGAGTVNIDELSELLREAQTLVKFCRQKLYSTDEDIKALLSDITDNGAE